MDAFINAIRSIGTGRLIVMGIVAAVLLTFFVTLMARVSKPPMSLLFGELAPKDSAQIVEQLEAQKVPYELRANGSQIYVPEDQVLRLRMGMAAEGLPSGGSVGYELFNEGGGLGTSNFVQNINRLRALEGELARTIMGIDGVQAARVHLVLPERQLFSRKSRKATASIVLAMKGASRLRAEQVIAIQNLAAAAVAELSPEAVSIVDQRGHLLSKRVSDPALGGSDRYEELRSDQEQRLQEAVERLLEQSVGVGNVRVQVTAEMDFDQTTTNSEVYDPDGQVVRSTQTVEESSSNLEGKKNTTVSVQENLPDGGNEQENFETQNSSSRVQETVNFEISKTISTQVHQSGTIKRLSVAVLVNGASRVAEDGTIQYQPRSEDDLKRLDALVKSAIGFDANRGDRVEVVNMQFAELESSPLPEDLEASAFSLSKSDYFRIAEIGALIIVALLLILLVIRPLLARMLAPQPVEEETGPQFGASALAHAPPALRKKALADPEIAKALESGDLSEDEYNRMLEATAAEEEDDNETIDIAMIEGRVKASSIKKVGELVDKHPEEAVSIMRNWMYQDG